MFAGSKKMSTFASANAEIAQLVEHNLAKVGVASSSLVFRSKVCKMTVAQVAELVDAHVSGACAERRAGSSPVLGTIFKKVINCGNSSVGRAQPCQGWGREFEPRFPLKVKVSEKSETFLFCIYY